MLQYYSPPSLALSFYLFLLLGFFPYSFLSPSFSLSPLRWTSPNNPCYHLDGRPRHCLSDFVNAAYGVPVQAEDLLQGAERNISTLTDLHNLHNLTCWTASARSVSAEWTLSVPLGRRFEVTYISLQFCQHVELIEPFSISILKSMDFGRSWRPLQYYSSDCMGRFGLPPQSTALSRHQETESLCSDPRPFQKHRGGVILAFSTLDGRPSSADFEYSPGLQDWVTATDIRIVFHQSQSKTVKPEKKPDEMDRTLKWTAGSKNEVTQGESVWFTETNGRRKGESRRIRNKSSSQGSGHNVTRKQTDTQDGRDKERGRKKDSPRWMSCQEGVCEWNFESQGRGSKGKELRKRRNNARNKRARSRTRNKARHRLSLSSLLAAPTLPLALSDIQVGGRCKCNGHASRCRRDEQGQAMCQCEHHTAGPDCDVCEPFYYDRPWQRATPTQPHPCVPCECNGHSTKCKFSMTVFQQSGRVSGGVCLKCRHHTTGRQCQFCQNGYTRDHSKPLNHRKTCQPCECHSVGAVGRWCNQSTGQCLCKEGVTGQKCNRCAPGYKHGRSPLRPCIRIPEVAPPTPMYQPQYSIDEECLSYCQPSQVKVRMNLETFCLKDYVLKVQVRAKERSGPWWQFSVWVQSVFRVGLSQVKRGLQSLWVPDRDVSCGCPGLQVGRTFLLIGGEENKRGWAPGERRMIADRSTMALQWREHWNAKLRGFRSQDSKGKCVPNTNSTTRTHSHLQTHEEYIPPHLKQHEWQPLSKSDHTHSHNNASNPHKDSMNVQNKQRHLGHDSDRSHNEDTQSLLQETQPPQPSTSDLPAKTSPLYMQQQPTILPTWSSSVTHELKKERLIEMESKH
ncbi:netrin-B [Trichomycterus rosablanca]|uniref:netrin-B n=1 Tax=Trichomycterus rosablanca TaxID=2290929 RepID=UPI002F3549E2